MPIFLKIVFVLEISLNLCVGAAINHGASPNRKCFRLHSNLTADPKCDVVYKTPSGFSTSRVHFLRRFATNDENSPQLPL